MTAVIRIDHFGEKLLSKTNKGNNAIFINLQVLLVCFKVWLVAQLDNINVRTDSFQYFPGDRKIFFFSIRTRNGNVQIKFPKVPSKTKSHFVTSFACLDYFFKAYFRIRISFPINIFKNIWRRTYPL